MLILGFFSLIYAVNASSSIRLTPTQAQHTWDLFKLHNVHIFVEISHAPHPGYIFQTISGERKHLVDLLLIPDRKVSLTLPLKSGWTRRYTIALPSSIQEKYVILVVVEKKYVSVIVNCIQLLLENIDDVVFTGSSPNMFVNNKYNNWRIDSGNPTRDLCPKLNSSLGNAEIETSEGLHEKEEDPSSSTGFRQSMKSCLYNGRRRGHTEAFWPEQCVRCYCEDGTTTCQYQSPIACPRLTCSVEHRVIPSNRCCPICVGADFCVDAHCHRDAECINHTNGAQCKCKEGFYGDGYNCHDIDECSFDSSAREQINPENFRFEIKYKGKKDKISCVSVRLTSSNTFDCNLESL
ncbi:hypothetical protein RB195_021688 [Necator americanus]|uniref:VWFC domain-containing protein n=1 Tax=Necator americanus TaxID=51031 RepID=A0ABR1EDA1_NECAM